jgi:hypothetical protein
MAIEDIKHRPGRPIGSPNKATAEVRAFTRAFITDPEYRENLRMRIMCGEAPAMEKLMWYYAVGKPDIRVEITSEAVVEKIVREIIDPSPQPQPIAAAPPASPSPEVKHDSIH